MRPKSKREEAILLFVAATLLIALLGVVTGASAWGIVGLVIVMLIGAFFEWGDSRPRL